MKLETRQVETFLTNMGKNRGTIVILFLEHPYPCDWFIYMGTRITSKVIMSQAFWDSLYNMFICYHNLLLNIES